MAILENYSGIGEKSDKQPSNSERRHVFSQALQPLLMNGKTNYQKNNSIVVATNWLVSTSIALIILLTLPKKWMTHFHNLEEE
jgi:predicted NACHT family NTPase